MNQRRWCNVISHWDGDGVYGSISYRTQDMPHEMVQQLHAYRNKAEELSEEEMNQQISVMASYYGYEAKELRALMEKNGSIDEVYFNMLSAKTLQFIADNMNK